MSESLTGGQDGGAASTTSDGSTVGSISELTAQTQTTQPTAESQNQETISREQSNQSSESTSQGAVSDDTASTQTQTQQKGGESTDDGLAKFAKSQGFDFENASEDVKRALKIAHDNQRAFREKGNGKSVVDATSELTDGSLEAEVKQLKYERQTDKFWADETKDRKLESSMVEILNEAKEKYGKEYAFTLSRDLPTLYGLAQVRNGQTTTPVDAEAIRREERESINKAISAGAPAAHAMSQGGEAPQKITREWIQNSYDSHDPAQRKLVDEYFSRQK